MLPGDSMDANNYSPDVALTASTPEENSPEVIEGPAASVTQEQNIPEVAAPVEENRPEVLVANTVVIARAPLPASCNCKSLVLCGRCRQLIRSVVCEYTIRDSGTAYGFGESVNASFELPISTCLPQVTTELPAYLNVPSAVVVQTISKLMEANPLWIMGSGAKTS